jgi:hypothetical protein
LPVSRAEVNSEPLFEKQRKLPVDHEHSGTIFLGYPQG